MNTVFDEKKLKALLQDFHRISGVRITVFDADLNEIYSNPEKISPICQLLRASEEGREACMRCDREGCGRALRSGGTEVYVCHAGLTEAATPLFFEGMPIGYLLIGHALVYQSHEEGFEAILSLSAHLPISKIALRAAVESSPLSAREYITSAASIMHAVASYLMLERMAGPGEEALPVRLNAILQARYMDSLRADDLAQELGIGRTQLYKLSEQLYGEGIAARIRHLRLKRAKELLAGSGQLSISEIASMCGYADYNYFIAVFSREEGCSPGKYRNAIAKDQKR